LLEAVACGRRLGAHLAKAEPRRSRGAVQWCERGPSLAPPLRARLRELLWSAAGPDRNAAALQRAIAECAVLRATGWQARVALALLQAAVQRGHCLGAHHRSDSAASMRWRMAIES
jgi:aspartate oxidase